MLHALIVLLCANVTVEPTVKEVVQQLGKIERLIDRGAYDAAREQLGNEHVVLADRALQARLTDLRALVILRAKQRDDRAGWIVTHFRDRLKANKRDARFQAWLAEAWLAEGNTATARALITELSAKDLMPDAFAYVVLAKVSDGAAREAAISTCRTRTKTKAICTLP